MITLILAAASTTEPPGDALSAQTAVLILLAGGLCYCLKRLADLHRCIDEVATLRSATPPTPAPRAPQPTSASSASGNAEPSPEILAVITAAVHVTLRGRHRLVGVVRLGDHNVTPWSVEGRREVFRSHRLR